MANYPLLRRGDNLPAVGVLQKLLNRGGARLAVDGDFGQATQTAVANFQRARGLFADGAVGQNSWPRISASANLPIMDCIDIFDPTLLTLEAADIRRAGGRPLVIGGACNGVEQAVQMIVAASPGNVFLLRFHGHGGPGVAGFSDGRGGFDAVHRTDVGTHNLRTMLPILSRLRGIFGPYGCIQFMHCLTGRGAGGRSMVTGIADALGVPATAAVMDQLGGGTTTFRFEGPTFTAIPGGGPISPWAASRPEFARMTVP